MKISRVWAVYFSPTGNVKEVTNLIAKKLSEELSVPLEQWDFTLPDNRKSAKAFEKEDLVVFGTPVYAGRVPNKILPWVQQGFTGDHTPMVPVVVFGNRNFDDALMELKQELEKNGFLAAAATVRKTSKKMKLLFYSLKVGFAVAASIFLLTMTTTLEQNPLEFSEVQQQENKPSITKKINDNSYKFTGYLQDATNRLLEFKIKEDK